ncbi:hypothetical protein [Arthrobacter sp. OV608]|nr:hypothetical protein [Arthrobacter sp. OV608]
MKAYAHDLKDFFVFLTYRGLDWRRVTLEDVGARFSSIRRGTGWIWEICW